MPEIDENMQFAFNKMNIESIYHHHFYEIDILFLWRTRTGENHNESGMDRKNRIHGSKNDRTMKPMNHESGANF